MWESPEMREAVKTICVCVGFLVGVAFLILLAIYIVCYAS